MSKLVLISCSSKKLARPARADNLYTSPLFKWSVLYVKKYKIPFVVLSAKYGVVYPFEVIEPYDVTLKNMKLIEREKWYDMVAEKLRGKTRRLIVLAGVMYTEGLKSRLPGVLFEEPLRGLSIGRRIQWLQKMAR